MQNGRKRRDNTETARVSTRPTRKSPSVKRVAAVATEASVMESLLYWPRARQNTSTVNDAMLHATVDSVQAATFAVPAVQYQSGWVQYVSARYAALNRAASRSVACSDRIAWAVAWAA